MNKIETMKRKEILQNLKFVEEIVIRTSAIAEYEVTHPEDYANSIDEMKGFLEGNVLKYVSRAGKKPGAPAHVDYEKALTYLKWLIQLELFGTIDTERTPKKQEIKPGIDL